MVNYNSNKLISVKQKRYASGANLGKEETSRKGFCVSRFVEFCKRTDLHGCKYIVMEDLNIFERSYWALAVMVSVGCAAFFVVTAYRWYARNPIVTVIESTQGAIWDVPFPAVTICDLNTVSKRAARAFANNLTLPANVTADFIFDTVRLVPLLHSTYTADSDQKQQLYKLQTVLDLNVISIESLYKKLSPSYSCKKLVQRCMWKNTIYRCDQLFQHVFTLLNLCCTFNYYAVDSTVENNMGKVRGNELFHLSTPRRVASCGSQTALTVLLNTDPDDYYSASVASQGALVFIDNAYNVPDLDSPVRMVNPSTEVLIALSPERTYTTPGIRAFSPEQRQCYYNNEVKVGDFRQYSFHNCMAYQKMALTSNVCDCVPFYFPLKGYHRTCNFNDLDCLENVLKRKNGNEEHSKSYIEQYECLPECEHYDYPIEVAVGNLAKNVQLSGLPFFKGVHLENRSVLNVFFNDLVSTRYRRDVYLNWQNILAAFGGLLGLMLGFTLVSGFDLILFCTVRVAYDSLKHFCAHTRHKNNKIDFREHHKKEAWTEKSVKQQMAPENHGKWINDMHYGNIKY